MSRVGKGFRPGVVVLVALTAASLVMTGSVGAVASASNQDSFNSRRVHGRTVDNVDSSTRWRQPRRQHLLRQADRHGRRRLPQLAQLDRRAEPSVLDRRLLQGRVVRCRSNGFVAHCNNVVGTSNADLYIQANTGKCAVDLNIANFALTSFVCDDNQWHSVELKGDFGATTYTLDWTVDGVSQTSISSSGLDRDHGEELLARWDHSGEGVGEVLGQREVRRQRLGAVVPRDRNQLPIAATRPSSDTLPGVGTSGARSTLRNGSLRFLGGR